jgi:alkanesulfonate monooxygenase SsuD/methylene tetrahydromethanopterin reductase-like flavin-dependent oxidoreductase (luciferase family)
MLPGKVIVPLLLLAGSIAAAAAAATFDGVCCWIGSGSSLQRKLLI